MAQKRSWVETELDGRRDLNAAAIKRSTCGRLDFLSDPTRATMPM
jgi:hypothetical protein